jgi:molybdopterin-guanine dinucleotide biosynthesis protein A
MIYTNNDVTAIILAGGLGRRLNGQNKGLIPLLGKTLFEHILDRIKPQTNHILINANQDISRYQTSNYPVIEDKYNNNQGPLAGILSCENAIKTSLILTIPCDTPILPKNLLGKMLDVYNKESSAQLCVAHDGNRLQNLFMLFDIRKLSELNHFFLQGHRKVSDWIHNQPFTTVDFSDNKENFININTEENLTTLINKLNNTL